MNDQDFIREVKNLIDRLTSEWMYLNSERDKEIERDLKAMKKGSNSETITKSVDSDTYDPISYDLHIKEKE